jgi:hypothetical protein
VTSQLALTTQSRGPPYEHCIQVIIRHVGPLFWLLGAITEKIIMPLDETTRTLVHDYCVRDLPGDLQWHVDQFSFVKDTELRFRLGRAYYSARYVYKLMEATFVSGDERHPFVKFQIMQYASIYEAVVVYLLFDKFESHSEVVQLQTHKAYKPIAALAGITEMKYGAENIFTCVYRDAKTPRNSIPFKDKVDCAVRIGFVDAAFAGDIKRTYELRNLAHIETEAAKQLEVEIEQSKTAYWRLQPFLEQASKC